MKRTLGRYLLDSGPVRSHQAEEGNGRHVYKL